MAEREVIPSAGKINGLGAQTRPAAPNVLQGKFPEVENADEAFGTTRHTLGAILRSVSSEGGAPLSDLTVLSSDNDPYRLDTPSNHRNAKWCRDCVERCGLLASRVEGSAMTPRKQKAGVVSAGASQIPDLDAPSYYHDSRFNSIDGCDFGDININAESKSWLVKSLVPIRGLVVLGGASGHGKSFLCIDLAIAVATGRDFLGHSTDVAPVLYISTEDAQEELKGRFMPHVERFFEVKDEVPLRLAALHLDIVSGYREALDKIADQAAALRHRRGAGPGLIILDTLQGMSHGLDENAPSGMGTVLRFLRDIEARHGCAVLVAHHTPQAGDRLGGHGSLHAAAQSVLLVAKKGDASALKVVKSKHGPSDGKTGFWLKTVQLAKAADGSPVTTCVIMPAVLKEQTPEERVSLDLKVMEVLQAKPEATQRELADALGVKLTKVNAALQKLALAGRLTKAGSGRSTRYVIPQEIVQPLAA
jgi:hypothetical protein